MLPLKALAFGEGHVQVEQQPMCSLLQGQDKSFITGGSCLEESGISTVAEWKLHKSNKSLEEGKKFYSIHA